MSNENIKLNEEQKKMVETHIKVAEITVNKFFYAIDGYITYKYSREDAYQDAMYALCKAAYKYDKDNESNASFYTFAQTVIKNHLLNVIAKHKKYKADISLESIEEESTRNMPFIEDSELLAKISYDDLLRFINQRKSMTEASSPMAYDIFLLHCVKGLKMDLITEQFHIARRTAYYKLSFAQNDLRQQLIHAA